MDQPEMTDLQIKLAELRSEAERIGRGNPLNNVAVPWALCLALANCAKSLDLATRELTLVYSLVEMLAEKVPDAQADCLKVRTLHIDNMAVYMKRLARLSQAMESR